MMAPDRKFNRGLVNGLILSALLWAGIYYGISAAFSQQAKVVSSCGVETFDSGSFIQLRSDLNGKLCTSGTGGSGGAVTQSGTWTVQPGNTANTTPWKVDDDATQTAVALISAGIGATTDAAATVDANATVIADLRLMGKQLDTLQAKINALSTCAGGSALCVEVKTAANASLNYTPPNSGAANPVGDTTSPTTCLAENLNRSTYGIENDSEAILYLLNSATGTVSATVKSKTIAPHGYFEPPNGNSGTYTGIIKCVWSSDAGGSAYVTEYTP